MPTTPAEARRLGIWASALTVVSIILFGRTEISFLHSYFDIRVLKVICEIASLAPIYAAFRCITLYAGGVKICKRFTLFAATYGIILLLNFFALFIVTIFADDFDARVGKFTEFLFSLVLLISSFTSWTLCIPAIFLILAMFKFTKVANNLFWGYCTIFALQAAILILERFDFKDYKDVLDYYYVLYWDNFKCIGYAFLAAAFYKLGDISSQKLAQESVDRVKFYDPARIKFYGIVSSVLWLAVSILTVALNSASSITDSLATAFLVLLVCIQIASFVCGWIAIKGIGAIFESNVFKFYLAFLACVVILILMAFYARLPEVNVDRALAVKFGICALAAFIFWIVINVKLSRLGKNLYFILYVVAQIICVLTLAAFNALMMFSFEFAFIAHRYSFAASLILYFAPIFIYLLAWVKFKLPLKPQLDQI